MNETSEILAYIAKNIKQLRKSYNLTLDDLAEKSNVHKNYLSRIENKDANITVNKLVSICNALNVHIADVLPTENSKPFSEDENDNQNTEKLSKVNEQYYDFFIEQSNIIAEKEEHYLNYHREILHLTSKLKERDLLLIIQLLTSMNNLSD